MAQQTKSSQRQPQVKNLPKRKKELSIDEQKKVKGGIKVNSPTTDSTPPEGFIPVGGDSGVVTNAILPEGTRK